MSEVGVRRLRMDELGREFGHSDTGAGAEMLMYVTVGLTLLGGSGTPASLTDLGSFQIYQSLLGFVLEDLLSKNQS
jgi:hypothetical protein